MKTRFSKYYDFLASTQWSSSNCALLDKSEMPCLCGGRWLDIELRELNFQHIQQSYIHHVVQII